MPVPAPNNEGDTIRSVRLITDKPFLEGVEHNRGAQAADRFDGADVIKDYIASRR